MNALVKASARTLAATQALDPFAAAGEEMGGSQGTYLKFNGNSGEFTFGAEAEELPLGSRLVVDMNSFRRGWICWKDNEVVDENMTRVIDGRPPEKHQLPDHGPYVKDEDRNDGWAEQAAVNFKSPDTGKEFIFKISSVSGLRALGTLLKDYGKDYKNHPGELPVVELDTGSFMPKQKKFGKKYTPKFNIVEWVSEEELAAQFGDNAADYEGQGGEEEDPPFEQEAPKQVEAPKAPPAQTAPAAGPRRRGF